MEKGRGGEVGSRSPIFRVSTSRYSQRGDFKSPRWEYQSPCLRVASVPMSPCLLVPLSPFPLTYPLVVCILISNSRYLI